MRRRIPINGSDEPRHTEDAAEAEAEIVGAPGSAAEAAEADDAAAVAVADGDTPDADAEVTDTDPAASDADAELAAASDADAELAAASDADPELAAADAVAAAALAVALAEAERDQYLDALQRLKAEFENYRRRAQRETAETGSRARVALLTEFLPILDNLDRALSAAEHHEEGKVLEGVRLTHNLFADLLRKEGVDEVEALGRSFDPTVHEALMTQESSEHEEGTITAVLERGYACGDRVLRPAKVAVSSGPSD